MKKWSNNFDTLSFTFSPLIFVISAFFHDYELMGVFGFFTLWSGISLIIKALEENQ